ncbi:MAG: prepilin peptidase [Syntrophomonadaceae bacterium]|nr:prepilin peptidase [Syntrophomonadaceae bacterium]
MVYAGIVIFALLLGSFLNVLIYRLPREESIVFPGSRCPSCSHSLKWTDLIPVVSFLALKGRCRYCNASISRRYPAVEVITAVSFVLVFIKWGYSLETLGGWGLNLVLISSAFIDLEHGIIPDSITYPSIIAGLVLAFFTVGLKSSLGGLALFAGILFLLAVLSGGGMGGGDIKLAGVIGAFAGFQGALTAFFISSIAGGIYSVILILAKKAGRKTMVKFGPFLALAGFFAYNYSREIWTVYLGFFIK